MSQPTIDRTDFGPMANHFADRLDLIKSEADSSIDAPDYARALFGYHKGLITFDEMILIFDHLELLTDLESDLLMTERLSVGANIERPSRFAKSFLTVR